MTWGLVAVAGATIYSAESSGRAIEEAADIQAEGSEAAAAESARQFDITQEQLAPFREAGVGALQQQQALLGLSGPEAERAALQRLEESPAQQFIRNRAQRSLLRNQAAIGGLGGGNVRTALQQQGAGFAQQDIQNQFNRLASLTGGGQTAATDIGQFGQQKAQSIGQFGMQGTQAQASGILGKQQAQSNLVGNLLQLGATYYGRNRPYSTPPPVGVAGVGA